MTGRKSFRHAQTSLRRGRVYRLHGISRATYFNWQAKYGGVSVSELKRMKGFEAENAKNSETEDEGATQSRPPDRALPIRSGRAVPARRYHTAGAREAASPISPIREASRDRRGQPPGARGPPCRTPARRLSLTAAPSAPLAGRRPAGLAAGPIQTETGVGGPPTCDAAQCNPRLRNRFLRVRQPWRLWIVRRRPHIDCVRYS
jgi:hypothetical protein